MPTTTNEKGNGTPRASHLSPVSTSASTLSPTWRPPKSPLPPHRLAKLANALGVSTPVPAGTPYLSRSFSESASTVDHARRSPTPSSAISPSIAYSSHSSTPQTSKFLLHVIPPLHLPHDSDTGDDTRTVPPPNAPGYHTQFRRGTLVPVHSTLQAQLGAIAKEYALPSSAGLILYLVTNPAPQSPVSQPFDAMDEPGPRLSEDIWKHLWTRVLRTEQRDDGLMPSRSPTPQTPHTPHTPRSPLMLRLAPAARSTPFLPQEQTAHLRPFISSPAEPIPPPPPLLPPHAPQPTYPTTPPAPSTPSSISDRQSNNKSAPPSSTSVSQSEPGTPDTSVEDSGLRANFLDLPGLNSPSLIPILAKVEFDIDRRKAGWYEPWLRSRKVNHAKRTESRKGSRNQESDGGEEQQTREHVPIELLTGKKKRDDPFGLLAEATTEPQEEERKQAGEEVGGGYARLSESPDEINSDSDSDIEDLGDDATAKVSASLTGSKDPLGDIFGSDAETWAEIRAENGAPRKYDNPNVVNLALTPAELDALPTEHDDDSKSTKEEDEVFQMLDIMGKPNLAINIPSPAKDSSPSVNGARKIPAPLVLKSKDKAAEPPVAALNGRDTVLLESPRLAYLGAMSESEPENEDADEFEEEYTTRVRSPAESDKRGGAVFDDLDLGLEPTEDFDDNDPNDRRRSQYLMSAQLDEIEKTMASLSPRFMPVSLEDEQNLSFNSATLSPSTPANLTLSPGRSFDFLPPPSPRLPHHPDPPEEELAGQSWPAVPFSTIKDRDAASPKDAPPSPPRLALNGVSTSAPKSYMPTSRSVENGPSESERRKKELEEEEALYIPPKRDNNSPLESPIIPLSPDPFGRHPSTPEPPISQATGAQWDTMTIGKGQAPEQVTPPAAQGRMRSSTTSRFSVDSVKGDSEPAPAAGAAKTANRATLISVKSIKKLWRKSNKSSTTNATPTEPVPPTPTAVASGRTSPMVPAVPTRPERPSEEQLYLPDVTDGPMPANFGRLSPNIPPPPQSQMPGRRSIDQQNGVSQSPANVGRLSPMAPPPSPHPTQEQFFAPRRPSIDQHNLPPQQPSNVGRLSPQPMGPPVPSGSRPSLEQQGRRPSQDQSLMPPPPQRQSLEQFAPPQQPPYPPQPFNPQQTYNPQQPYNPPQLQPHFQQLSVPSYPGRNPNPGPIITPYMKASKAASNLDRLHFDQESPYPTHRSTSLRQSPRPPSPPPLPAIPEQERVPEQDPNGGRKSILRWKSAASTSSNSSTQSDSQPRASLDRSSTNGSGGSGGRRPSIVNYGSTRTSVTSAELPPSPQIPGQFVKNGGLDHRTSQRSRLTTSSTDSSYSPPQRQISLGARSSSPQRSMASSRDSQGSRPSFDASQFEFVSPKVDTLSYPYNAPDQ